MSMNNKHANRWAIQVARFYHATVKSAHDDAHYSYCCLFVCLFSFAAGVLVNKRYFADASPGQYIKTKIVDGVLVCTLDAPNSKVNSLGAEMQAEFEKILQDIETNPSITSAVITSAKPGCFVAGADISMLEKCKTAADATKIAHAGQILFDRLEKSRKPVVAAINGVCLGGGLEFALACHYRIATKDKKTALGFPEVMLGLLPGAGGTQRLPKLTSVPTALDLELTGKSVKADKAKKLGIVDLLVTPLGPGLKSAEENTREYLEQTAISVAKDIASGKLKVCECIPKKIFFFKLLFPYHSF